MQAPLNISDLQPWEKQVLRMLCDRGLITGSDIARIMESSAADDGQRMKPDPAKIKELIHKFLNKQLIEWRGEASNSDSLFWTTISVRPSALPAINAALSTA